MKWHRKEPSNRWIIGKLNDMPIRRKLIALFIFCILFPLLITDTLVLWMLVDYQKGSIRHDTLNAAEYYLTSTFEDAAGTARSIYLNKYINNFLNTDFESPLDYYNNYLKLLADSLYVNSLRDGKFAITIYAKNNTILNGGSFRRLDDQLGWYQALNASGQDSLLLANYDDSHTISNSNLRQVSMIRRMNYYLRDTIEKVVKVDISYSRIEADLQAANYEADLYVCLNGQLIFSNVHSADLWTPFEDISPELIQKSSDVKSLDLYNCDLTIYAVDRSVNMGQFLYRNWPPLLLLISLNLLLPSVFISYLNRSFIERLQLLTTTVKSANDGVMPLLEQVQGQDEIGMLMGTYNDMAQRTNLLIETVYKSRLREQEIDLARQQAELLALRSQINPHFLFNVLESIRMQSLLKDEKKTAEMIGMLAYIERQYVDWGADVVPLSEELRYVDAYLRLQQYRLGNRFSYRIDVQPDCETLQIPKLSLLTFVENACVHGVSRKESHGWIFVRIHKQDGTTFLEVEDTGIGMSEDKQRQLEEQMNQASIEMLKGRKHVGMINACLRLKKTANGSIHFTVESEEEIGTTITTTLEEVQRDAEKRDIAESTAG